MPHQQNTPIIEGYDLVQPSSADGRASLWPAQQVATRRQVAIKLFSRHFTSQPDDLALFMELAPKITALQHPGLIPVIDFGFARGRYYFVMDHFAGTTLDDFTSPALPFCDQGLSYMPENKALDLAQAAAEVLQYADQTGHILHGNIKPENLIWSENRLKIMDLGVLFAMGLGQPRRNAALAAMAFGTPGYMAPEQIQRQVGLDCRADMYALGLTLYHFLTGHKPFEGTDHDIVSRQITDALSDPRDYNARLSENTVMLLINLTSNDPSDRPANWTEVLAQLQALHQGQMPVELRHQLNSNTIQVERAAPSAVTDIPLRKIPSSQASSPESGTGVPVKDSGDDYKACPFCAERIRRQAKVCRFCKRSLTKTNDGADESGGQRRPSPHPKPKIKASSMVITLPPVRSTRRLGKYAMVALNLFLFSGLLSYGYMKLFRHKDFIQILKQAVIEHYSDPDILEAEAWEKTQGIAEAEPQAKPSTGHYRKNDQTDPAVPPPPAETTESQPADSRPVVQVMDVIIPVASSNAPQAVKEEPDSEDSQEEPTMAPAQVTPGGIVVVTTETTTTATSASSSTRFKAQSAGQSIGVKPTRSKKAGSGIHAKTAQADTGQSSPPAMDTSSLLPLPNQTNGPVLSTTQPANTPQTWAMKEAQASYVKALALFQGTESEPKNEPQAAVLFQKAADLGLAEAQYCLGFCCLNGAGVPADSKKAATWFRKAADQGLAEAQYQIAVCYTEGIGTDPNPTRAAKFYRAAAEQGLAQAQYNIGVCYATGQGVTQDREKAIDWLIQADQQGLVVAGKKLLETKLRLGLDYQNGKGVPRDFKKAATWIEQAAEGGLAEAQYYLGLAYVNGQGVPKDKSIATTWMQKAAAQNQVQAKLWLKQNQPRLNSSANTND